MAAASFNFSPWAELAGPELLFGMFASTDSESQIEDCRLNVESSTKHEAAKPWVSSVV
jgi:hypothetical protein